MTHEREDLITPRSTTSSTTAQLLSINMDQSVCRQQFGIRIRFLVFKCVLKTHLFIWLYIYCVWSCNYSTVLYGALESPYIGLA